MRVALLLRDSYVDPAVTTHLFRNQVVRVDDHLACVACSIACLLQVIRDL